ncbi:MAG: beta-propeller fold lactonase family protein [Leptospira sp.]|nr:beta-propeller fold lactonase family protein [Leptospira sp.]
MIQISMNACLLNPIVQSLIMDKKDKSPLLCYATFASLLSGPSNSNNSTSQLPPQISSLSISSGIEGEAITITGTNFSNETNGNKVLFSNSVEATIDSFSSESISVHIPIGAKSGQLTVTTQNGLATSSGSITVYRYFVYAPGGTNANIYKLDINNGALTAISGSPFANTPIGFFHPNGKFMYTSTGSGPPNNVIRYNVNNETGQISLDNLTYGSANNYPTYLFFHPSGNFLYATNYTTLDISAFSIDVSNGNLTKIGEYPTSCGCTDLAQINVSTNGKFLYVTGNNPSQIIAFLLNQSTGIPSLAGSVAVPGSVDEVMIHPNSTFVYAVSSVGNISGASINQTTGGLTLLSGSPFTGNNGNYRGAMHPSGNYLYTVNIVSAPISVGKHNIATDGSLSAVSNLSFGTNLQFVSLDPSGKYGFVNNGSGTNTFYEFSIDQNSGTASLLNGGSPINVIGNAGKVYSVRIAQ